MKDLNSLSDKPLIDCENKSNLGVLHGLITGSPLGGDKINVIPIEPGGFKSRQTERSLAWSYLMGMNCSTLFVKQYAIEGAYAVREINRMARRKIACMVISERTYLKPENYDALCTMSDNELFILYPYNKKKGWLNEETLNALQNYYIVVITHGRYVYLADSSLKNVHALKNKFTAFSGGQRKNLIIDEGISLFNPITADMKLIEEVRDSLPEECLDEYELITDPIVQRLFEYTGKTKNREIKNHGILDGTELIDKRKLKKCHRAIISKIVRHQRKLDKKVG